VRSRASGATVFLVLCGLCAGQANSAMFGAQFPALSNLWEPPELLLQLPIGDEYGVFEEVNHAGMRRNDGLGQT